MKDVKKMVDSNGVVMQIVDGAARDMIAAEYDETESYAAGDYCIYDNHYYKCNTAIPSGGETWDATHWDATTLGAEDREIKQSLSNKNFDYSDFRAFISRPVGQDIFIIVLPCLKPLPTSVTVNSAAYWSGSWTNLTLSSASVIGESIVLSFNLPTNSITSGLNYWAKGSVTLNYT